MSKVVRIVALLFFLFVTVRVLAMNDITFNMKEVFEKVRFHPDFENVLPDETATSLPVPLLVQQNGATEIRMVFFHYYMTKNSATGINTSSISPPWQKTIVRYPELTIVETKSATSKSFGVDWDDSKPVGEYVADPDISYDQIVEQRDRFFSLYDKILPLYIAKASSLSDGAKQDIKEFNSLFREVGFPSLMPYYKSLNPDFFQWLDQNAQ